MNILISRGLMDKKAIVLTMALYIIIIFVVIGLVLVSLMTVVSQSSYKLLYSTQAYYLTESGLEYGLYALGNTYAQDANWLDGIPANLATNIAFNPPNQSNCTFSVGFSVRAEQNGTLISVGSVEATQVFSLDRAPAQRVVSMDVPRIY